MKTRFERKIPRLPFLLWWVCLAISPSASSQEVDPFYIQAFEKAQKAFLAKDFPSAVKGLEIAVFGLQKDKKLNAKACAYLGLSYYYLKNMKASEDNLRTAWKIMGEESLDSLDIQGEARADLDMLLGYFNIKPAGAEPVQKKDVEKPKEEGPEADSRKKEAPGRGETSVPSQSDKLKMDEIKEGDTVPLALVDSPPLVVKSVQAILPSWAKSQGIKGSVIVNALISEKGRVIKTEILRGIKDAFGLDQAAARAVQQWEFEPATVKEKKVKVWMQITVNFGQEE